MLTRRDALKGGVVSCLIGALSGCVNLNDLQPNCPVSWAPSYLYPVFYGYKDYESGNGEGIGSLPRLSFTNPLSSLNPFVPGRIRVYYPSLDGSPQNAAILSMCERFPLVLLIHGDCGGNPYLQWIELPVQLARAGYVVVVSQYGGTNSINVVNPDTTPLHEIHQWMRTSWEHRDRLMPSPFTAVIGHSFGGLIGAHLIRELPVTAFVSLSGALLAAQDSDNIALLSGIPVPSLCLWNDTDDADNNARLDVPFASGTPWSLIPSPKHGVVFPQGKHADYLLVDGPTTVCRAQSMCAGLVRALAADFSLTFLSKYMPPEFAYADPYEGFFPVPDSLIVSPQTFPPQPNQGFYAGAFWQGFSQVTQSASQGRDGCTEMVMWQTATSGGTTFLVQA